MSDYLETIDTRDGSLQDEEKQFDLSLRPTQLGEYIGQKKVKDNLRVFMKAALKRREALDHILLFGPPGVGKCITAESLISTSRGLIEFLDLIPREMKADSSLPFEIEIFGINGAEKTSHIYFSGNAPTLKLKTSSGFSLEGTPHHPILTASGKGLVWKTLSQLSADDFVAVGNGANIWNDEFQTAEWLSATAAERRLRTESAVSQLHRILSEKLGRSPAVGELIDAYGNIFDLSYKYCKIGTVAHRLNLPFSDSRKLKGKFQTFAGQFSIDRAARQKITLDRDLAYLLGVLIGDGNVEKGASFPAFVITCEEKEIQEEIQRIARKHFGRTPKVSKCGAKAAKLRFSRTIGKVALDFGIKPVNAGNKTVPKAILESPRESIVGFLQGLFDADGYVRKDGLIDFGSRSEKLIFQLQILLANFGIISHLKIKNVNDENFYRLVIGGSDAVKFHKLIGFRLSRKKERGENLQFKKRGWSKSDLVPFANSLISALFKKSQPHSHLIHKFFDHVKSNNRTPTRSQILKYIAALPDSIQNEPEFHILATLFDKKIYWDKVTDISPSKADVYDFVVPQTHSFVANGFFNHNTTLSNIVANEMGAQLKSTAGPIIEKSGDLAAILTNLEEGDVLFIDEIHRMSPAIEEVLYPAMEDYNLDLMIGQGTAARSIKLELPKFTLIGATTRPGLITAPLRGRFGIVFHLDFYNIDDLKTIIERSADILKVEIEPNGATEIAKRSRGTPRIANRLLRRVRDYAEVDYDGRITEAVAQDALNRMEVDVFGLDEVDRKLLLTIIEKFDGGPVGLGTISASIHEEKDSIEEIIEPYLIQIGFLNRTPRGRLATRLAYEHFGLDGLLKTQTPNLFE